MTGIRAFIAVPLPEELLGRLSEVQEALKAALRTAHADGKTARGRPVAWTRPAGIHLTLKFLGDIDPASVDEIAAALERAARGIAPFTLVAGGRRGGGGGGDEGNAPQEEQPEHSAPWVDGFPGLRNPRVVFTSMVESPGLATLREKIERELEAIGIERDRRPFHPHLTLCRVKASSAGRVLGEAAGAVDAGGPVTFTVRSFSLIQSRLAPGGATYTELKSIGLAAHDNEDTEDT